MKLIVGNQKGYLEEQDINKFVEEFKCDSDNVIICPSNIYFNKFKDTNISLGSQNVSSYPSGATTGEISCEQLKSMGINVSIIGHSERREKLKESIEDTNVKIKRLLDNEMIPILCVGETKAERELNKTKDIIYEELYGALSNVDENLINKVIIAYEPIWAIGTGLVPSNDEIVDVIQYIKDVLKEKYNSNNKVLYGGSVSIKNIEELNEISIVDGYLIGGASTKALELLQIIEKTK